MRRLLLSLLAIKKKIIELEVESLVDGDGQRWMDDGAAWCFCSSWKGSLSPFLHCPLPCRPSVGIVLQYESGPYQGFSLLKGGVFPLPLLPVGVKLWASVKSQRII